MFFTWKFFFLITFWRKFENINGKKMNTRFSLKKFFLWKKICQERHDLHPFYFSTWWSSRFTNEFKQNFDLDLFLFPPSVTFNGGLIKRQEKQSSWNTPRPALPAAPAPLQRGVMWIRPITICGVWTPLLYFMSIDNSELTSEIQSHEAMILFFFIWRDIHNLLNKKAT